MTVQQDGDAAMVRCSTGLDEKEPDQWTFEVRDPAPISTVHLEFMRVPAGSIVSRTEPGSEIYGQHFSHVQQLRKFGNEL